MHDNARRRVVARYEDRCAQRKAQLDVAAHELMEVCRTLGDVTAVFAYGSYARQAVGPESDLDALIVRDSSLPRFDRQDDIRQKLRSAVGFDLLVVTPQEFDNNLPFHPVAKSILSEAILLEKFDTTESKLVLQRCSF